jgi:hypothetical protein
VRSLLSGELGDTRAIQPAHLAPFTFGIVGPGAPQRHIRYPAAERLSGLRQMKARRESSAGESITGDWITKA